MRSPHLLLFAALIGLAGCSAPPPGPPVHPVEGTVVVGGRKAANAAITFHPLAPDAGSLYPVGVTGPDGTFRLTTRTSGDGAPAGEYAVTVLWIDYSIPFDCCEGIDLTQHDRLHGQYADPATTPLRATVVPGPNAVVLHADPGSRGWNLPRRGK